MAKDKPIKGKGALKAEIMKHPFSDNTVVPWGSDRHKVPQLGAVGRALMDSVRKER